VNTWESPYFHSATVTLRNDVIS